MCIKYEERIKSIKGFSRNCIVGKLSVKKDSLEKHIKGDPHKYTANHFNMESMGASSFADEIIKSSPIDVASLKWQLMIKKSWNIISTQFIIWPRKKDHIYSDFPDLIELQEKNGVKYCGSYWNE